MSTDASDISTDSMAVLDYFRNRRDALWARSSPRQRAILDMCVVRTEAEMVTRDIDVVMETLAEEPVFVDYGMGAEPRVLRGRNAVRSFYLSAFQTPADTEGLIVDHFVLDDHAVAITGWSSMSNAHVISKFPVFGALLAEGRPFVVRKRVAVICTIDDDDPGRMTGEIRHWDGPFGPEDVVYVDQAAGAEGVPDGA
jgi:hypothetical protein